MYSPVFLPRRSLPQSLRCRLRESGSEIRQQNHETNGNLQQKLNTTKAAVYCAGCFGDTSERHSKYLISKLRFDAAQAVPLNSGHGRMLCLFWVLGPRGSGGGMLHEDQDSGSPEICQPRKEGGASRLPQ